MELARSEHDFENKSLCSNEIARQQNHLIDRVTPTIAVAAAQIKPRSIKAIDFQDHCGSVRICFYTIHKPQYRLRKIKPIA